MKDDAAVLTWLANDLDQRGYPYVGYLRQIARRIATGQSVERSDDGCQGCGQPIEQKPKGRRRVWCSDRCRRGNGR